MYRSKSCAGMVQPRCTCTTFLALAQSVGVPAIVRVKESQDTPSTHVSSEVKRPLRPRSPVAPPATAVPCQVIGDEVVVKVPEVGFEASTRGNATKAMLKNAKMQRSTIKTPNEFSARQEISLEKSEAAGACVLFLLSERQFLFAFRFIDEQLLWSGE